MGSKKVWTNGRFDNVIDNAHDHWVKHKKEFPNFDDWGDYVKNAWEFMDNPPSGTLRKIRQSDGAEVFYKPGSEWFLVKDRSGSPRTFFKPNPSDHGFPTNLDYSNAQN